ncbi:MAG: cytochrome c biogenesis protein CcsA [Bacteroidales bacterium]|nr:cytochrome c biogenesis protein CcsA [Bacteroidales bacterium]
MKKVINILFSIRTTVVLLSIFAIAIGYATFVENASGTPAAKALVYNANWFVLLLILLIVNLIAVMVKNKLVERKKWAVLLFHAAFICILIGSAITRYFGFEGVMHIRQGETSSQIMTEKTALNITAEYNGQTVEKSTEVDFSASHDNTFSETLEVGGKKVTVDNELFVPNAQEMIQADNAGVPAAAIFIMSGASQSMDLTLFGDEKAFAGDVSFGFEGPKDFADIIFSVIDNQLYFKSHLTITKTGTMASGMIDRANAIAITPGDLCLGVENTVYRADKLVFMIKGFLPKAAKTLTQVTPMENAGMGEEMNQGSDALMMRISDGNIDKKVNVVKSESEFPQPSTCDVNGVKVSVSYGKLMYKLPFSITLRAFQLDRYQGSMSPSSYASEITLKDTEMKSERPYRIFMNNILNYRGYRFFQSSYDQDEQGTILSVNHDYWGTMVTYLGYLMMLIGMVMTLFSKKSRFFALMEMTNKMQQKRKAATIIALLFAFGSMYASPEIGIKKEDHLKAFSSLLIQDGAQGRIEPVNTFASDILRKIYKHTDFNKRTPTEVFLGMITNPSAWKNERIIKVSHDQLASELGAINGYVSYNQMFDSQTGAYKLKDLVDKAYIKDQSKRNTYEKEIVYVDERFNILNQIFDGTMLAFFPTQGMTNGKWTSAKSMHGMSATGSANGCPYCAEKGTGAVASTPAEESHLTGEMPPMDDEGADEAAPAMTAPDASKPNPHQGMGAMPTPDPAMGPCTRGAASAGMGAMTGMATTPLSALTLSPDSPEMLQQSYFDAVNQAMKTGNWSNANEALTQIKSFQTKNGGSALPSESNINLEIAYNEWNLFGNLAMIYGLIGAILLGLHLFNIFKYSRRLERGLTLAIYPLALLFAVFTFGLGLRWIISGHAPWSNGYESMVFVGWASSLAGILFARKSPLAFSVTALLSSIALGVAGMSWMNPEITNLVPVLKSYWLVVHVAVISSSYGFFAMGMILGLVNLVLMIARSKYKSDRLSDMIKEISYIIEMGLIVGLFMLTVGNFLGGVWANESWGRYWGWDAKETWALVSILVYAVVLHVRMIPKANNPFTLSALSVVAFSSIIMTFLGVNYYLAGMHSYGKGTPPPLPDSLFFVILAVVAILILAFFAEKKYGTFKK